MIFKNLYIFLFKKKTVLIFRKIIHHTVMINEDYRRIKQCIITNIF